MNTICGSAYQIGDRLTQDATGLTMTINRVYPNQYWGLTDTGDRIGFSTLYGHNWHLEATK